MSSYLYTPVLAYHLVDNQGGCCMNEETVWCGDDRSNLGSTNKPSEAGCLACLKAAADFGRAAENRRCRILFPPPPLEVDDEV